MPMQKLMKSAWWAMLIGGIASVIFGIMAFAWPKLTLLVLAIFFAASVFVDGVFSIVGAIRNRGEGSWWLVLLFGIVGVVAGGYAMFQPEAAALALLVLVATYAIVSGALLVATGWKLREEIRGEWLLILAGILSVAFGALLIARPGAGLLSLVWLVAAWSVATGALRIAFAFKARRFVDRAGEKLAALNPR
ncbi:MAG: HdeD family acid-resistance protein [Burkholderiales bacterium]|jgi:uncharacterized membrane protein HdeD (DUF308 family)|nr:HdeD family acid-resistance protein [Burkholderiales bacterium]